MKTPLAGGQRRLDPQLSGVGGLVLERGVDLYPRLDEGLSFANGGETALTQATQYSRGF